MNNVEFWKRLLKDNRRVLKAVEKQTPLDTDFIQTLKEENWKYESLIAEKY